MMVLVLALIPGLDSTSSATPSETKDDFFFKQGEMLLLLTLLSCVDNRKQLSFSAHRAPLPLNSWPLKAGYAVVRNGQPFFQLNTKYS